MTTELADPVDPVSAPSEAAGMAVDDAMRAAERLLAARLGAQVRLADPEDLGGSGRSTVLRVRVARTPFTLPRTLVVKHNPQRAHPGGVDPFAREAASCQLFNALRPEDRPGPELIACDTAARLLVLEDLGRSGTVASLLHSTGPRTASRAEQVLLDWAHALGRLHAATRDREPDFAALLRRLGAPQVQDPLVEHGRSAVAGLPALLAAELGVRSGSGAVRDARRAAELLGSRLYRAFSPGDLGSDNAVVGRSVRFIDFEAGGFRTALLDAIQLCAPLPTSLNALAFPRGMGEAMVSAWHSEVVAAWPELADRSLLARRLLDGRLLWTWLCTWLLLPAPPPCVRVAVFPVVPDDPAAVTDRGAVLVDRWERLVTEADAVGYRDTVEHATAVADALRRQFAVRGDPLLPYPVFR